MMTIHSERRVHHILAQGPRLNQCAVAKTRDLNEAYLVVHGVLARAMDASLLAMADLDQALAQSLARWRGAAR